MKWVGLDNIEVVGAGRQQYVGAGLVKGVCKWEGLVYPV